MSLFSNSHVSLQNMQKPKEKTNSNINWRDENQYKSQEFILKEYHDAMFEYRMAETEFLHVKSEFDKYSAMLQQNIDFRKKVAMSPKTEDYSVVEEIELKKKLDHYQYKPYYL